MENQVLMENKEQFECLLIEPHDITNLSFSDPDYSYKLMNLDAVKSVTLHPENFMLLMSKYLELEKYNFEGVTLNSDIIGEEPNYVYEIYYVDLKDKKEYHTNHNFVVNSSSGTNHNKVVNSSSGTNVNMIANLLNTNGETIYSNAIVLKTFLPSLSDSMTLKSIMKQDLGRLLYNRVYTKIVTFDGHTWAEKEVLGELQIYAEKFLEETFFKKISFGFLVHNIHIWYTSDFGSKDVCGKLLDDTIESCIIFTMKTDEFRGNITLKEVNKLIELSKVLPTSIPPEDLLKERFDKLGRKIINNKYKILDYMCDKMKIKL
jgi:hypothetical protein